LFLKLLQLHFTNTFDFAYDKINMKRHNKDIIQYELFPIDEKEQERSNVCLQQSATRKLNKLL